MRNLGKGEVEVKVEVWEGKVGLERGVRGMSGSRGVDGKCGRGSLNE